MEIRVRQQVIDGDEEAEDRAQRNHERERVGKSPVTGDPWGVVLEQVEADRPREEPDKERHQQAISITTARPLPRTNGRFGRP